MQTPNTNVKAGKWYVMDCFATSLKAAIMAGPFDTRREAELERRAMNIADDCECWQAA